MSNRFDAFAFSKSNLYRYSEGILRGMKPETAQRKGRALLGLRCVNLRGGLLGKTVGGLDTTFGCPFHVHCFAVENTPFN